MPSLRKNKNKAIRAANKKKLLVKVAAKVPVRSRSIRIKTNAEIKQEPEDEDESSYSNTVNSKKKIQTKVKPRGKAVQVATSVKEKAKKIASNKKKRAAESVATRSSPKMTVLALAAARKRKLNGEDDVEPPRPKKQAKKQVSKKKVAKKKPASSRKNTSLPSGLSESTSEDVNHDEEVIEEAYDDQPMVAVKQDEQSDYELSQQNLDRIDEEDDNEEQRNILIHSEHQYIDQIVNDGEIEVPQEQVQAELQQEMDEDEDEPEDEEEDIDENLFFGIPEQRSPDLASCTHCKGKFRKEDVHEHMLTCPERYVQCRECGKILSNLQTLERHHKRFHLKIREVPCTLCDKMFIDEAAARKHLKTVHFKVKNFHCPHCDKSFSQRNKLTYHVRTHSGEKPYSCAECGRSFSLLWNLKTHLRTHTGEKPYACDTCGRRFTQKQNMTSHLTTHRKPKSDKSFRSHFPSELDDYDSNTTGIISTDYSTKSTKSYRAYEQAKQLAAQSIGSGHYVLGDMQSIEVHTATDQDVDQNINLEHGLGLLSSVARKGDIADVQVDGIVNIPESQLNAPGGNLDQVVEVLIRSNDDTDKSSNALPTLQFGNGNQSRIILDPNTQGITDADGQEIPMDTNTAAGLANILQNPDVLAAINSAASTNKFIVIGPVSMFDDSSAQTSGIVSLSSTDGVIGSDATSTFSQEQLAQLSAMVQQEQVLSNNQVPSQTVNDSISATTALAAVESYLHGEQPSSSIGKPDEVVTSILGSIQPDGKRGPSAIVQSAQASMSRASNLTISMPPMSQSTLTISPSNLAISADSTQRLKPLVMHTNVTTSSAEVSSSIDHVGTVQQSQPTRATSHQQQMEAESTTQSVEFSLTESADSIVQNADSIVQSGDTIDGTYIQAATSGAADSSDMVVDAENEATSSGEPILMLSTDENGQPQIIVKMPDGSETIMSDPTLAESLIQVPTITNADMENTPDNDAEPSQSMVIDQMAGTIQLQLPDQGIPQHTELPTQSNMQAQFVSQSVESSSQENLPDQSLDDAHQRPDQSLDNVHQLPDQGLDDAHQLPDQSLGDTHQLPDQSLDDAHQLPDQSLDNVQQLPDQSLNNLQELHDQSLDDAHQLPDQGLDNVQQLPDQSLDSEARTINDDNNVDSSDSIESSEQPQQSLTDNSNNEACTPDSSSQSYQRIITENHIDSRQGIFVMEHVSASDEPEQSNFAEQSNIDFTEHSNTEFIVDSSSNKAEVSGNSYLQLDDVSQSTNTEGSNEIHAETENVSSTEQTGI